MRSEVLTLGTFDLLHAGHVDFLQRCRALGRVTVAVNGSEYVRFFKVEHPVLTTEERMVAVKGYCDEVVHNIGKCDKIIENWIKVCTPGVPRILAIGADWAGKNYLTQLGINNAFLMKHNIMLIYIHATRDLHSTEVIRRCQDRKRPSQ